MSRIVKLFFVALLISVVSCIKANPDPEKRQTRSSFTFTSDVANTSKSGTKAVRLLGVVTKSSDLGIYGGDLKFKEQATRFFHTQKIKGVWFLIDPDGYRFCLAFVPCLHRYFFYG